MKGEREVTSIQGLIPPMITPLIDRDRLDLQGLENLVERLVAADVDGLFILGTSGEGPGLSYHLRRELITRTADLLSDRKPLLVGITDTSLVEAIRLAEHCADHSVTALVAAPPFYFPAGQTELHHWYEQLVAELSLPLMLYNMPGCTKIAIGTEILESLINIEKIIGLKDSSGDLGYLSNAVALAKKHRPGWPVLIGPEHLLKDGLLLGAAGGVAGGANLVPGLFTETWRAFRANDTVALDQLHELILQLQTLYSFGKYESSFVKSIKCALELSGVCNGRLVEPFDAFKQRERKLVAEWLVQFSGQRYLPKPSFMS